ncbi:uncharacterized protein LOC133737239 [Rosa rugosa]|uniref:uncharacterized protein LOC133737239 n=1 Tax=Rosa rugosa TaxID=74645 RepID=UPI002B405CFC|nr:uncharacterized protein LOC133737239 [Rosa rugosa]
MDEDLRTFFSDRVSTIVDLLSFPGVWNSPLLSELFPAHIVQEILSIPLCPWNHEDRWIWASDKRGRFTVKSAYHIARDRILEDLTTPNPSAAQVLHFGVSCGKHQSQSGLAARSVPKWKKPPMGFVKLNVDAAFDQASGHSGLGGVFREHDGAFLHGFRHSITMLAIENNLAPLIVETDCLDLVSPLASAALDWSELGFLLEDLRALLHKALEARVLKVGRQANGVAHVLAQEAKNDDF